MEIDPFPLDVATGFDPPAADHLPVHLDDEPVARAIDPRDDRIGGAEHVDVAVIGLAFVRTDGHVDHRWIVRFPREARKRSPGIAGASGSSRYE
jgi:hypothetical protein